MERPHLPLNALRAFEASARHLSFTRAGLEMHVSQAAVSHHVKRLEDRLGVRLFRRLPRGLALTDEGAALLPAVSGAFDAVGATLARFSGGRYREVLTVGVVSSFATGWLLPRLADFAERHPFVDLRVMTNNNRVDLAGEGLDCAIRFGDGAWHGTQAEPLIEAPLSPACAPALAAVLRTPDDLGGATLMRSYRPDEWSRWFAAAGVASLVPRGPVFDSSVALAEAAARGLGVALLPVPLFGADFESGRLVRPFATEVSLGRYWLTRLNSRRPPRAMEAFRAWIVAESVDRQPETAAPSPP